MFEFLYVLTIYGKFGGWVGPEGPLTVFFSIGSCIFFLRPPWLVQRGCPQAMVFEAIISSQAREGQYLEV